MYRGRRTRWGAARTLGLYISPPGRRGQIRSVHQPLTKRLEARHQWPQTFATPRRGPRSTASVQKRIAAWQAGQYLPHVLTLPYHPRRQGTHRLTWESEQAARDALDTAVLGQRLRMTDHHAWSTEDLMLAYQGQSHAAAAFRQLNEVEPLTVRPPYPWTAQKGRVPTCICVLASLLCRLIERACRTLG